MFSPSSIHNPFQHQHQARNGNSSIDDPMPNSLQEVNLSSPFLIDGDDFLGEFLSQQQVLLGPNAEETQETCPAASSKATKLKEKRGSNSSDKRKPAPRKRTGKKDRHSKIYTAQGPRDRRMRLSLPIARKFFDLQDVLGFDKASKTIEWLFKKSKTAIKEIKNGFPGGKSTNVGGKSVYCTSESEVVSGMKHTSTSSLDKEGLVGEGENSLPGTPKEKRSKGSHKPSFRPVARESREMARARARERTREKMKSKGLDKTSQSSRANPSSLEPIRPITHLEDDEQLGLEDPGMNCPRQGVGVVEDLSSHFLQHQMDSVSIIDKYWGASTRAPRSSSSADLSFSHSLLAPGEANILEHEFSGFLANRVINNDRIQHRYCVVPTFKLSTSNFDGENPNLISMTNPNPRDPNPTPVLMNTSRSQENDSSPINLMGFSNIFIDENPSSIPLTTTNTHTLHSNQIGSPFSYNPPPNNYGSFY